MPDGTEPALRPERAGRAITECEKKTGPPLLIAQGRKNFGDGVKNTEGFLQTKKNERNTETKATTFLGLRIKENEAS